jgi:flagellar assembly protein FliH
MLSRIISGRDADRAEAAVFLPAGVPIAPRPRAGPSDPEADAEQEILVLRDQIRQLQAENQAVRRDSFEAGRKQGEQQARGEIAPVIERMNSSVAELTGLRHELRSRAEKDVVQLALLIAKRILHRELSVDPNALTALARVVFERMARAESYEVTVNPLFLAAVQAALPPGRGTSRIHIQSDPSCAPGTLVIRSEEGLIDASVDAQLEEIGRGLTDRLSGGGTGSGGNKQ